MQGTCAHELGQYLVEKALGKAVSDPTNDLSYYDSEMQEAAEGYAAFVLEQIAAAKELCPDPLVCVEQTLDFSKWVEHGFGTGDCVIVADTEDEDVQRNARFLSEYLRDDIGLGVRVADQPVKGKTILLRLNKKMQAEEGYRLTVGSKGVTIEALTARGIFYGIQTLRKSLIASDGKPLSAVWLPAVVVEDAPRFAYRGMHLDVARHFFGVDFVKQYIDMMALHNMNTFHWHLTDDQGWRIEIKRYPKLAELGSVRNYTTLGRNSAIDDETPYSGCFTQEEAREIVHYAADRFITVIPEIDMPGHMLGALKAYPELGCTGGPYEVEGHWGVFDDIFCAGREETFQFVEGVLEEIMEVFPSEYIHIGGDEAPRTRWEKCPRCQKRIADEGIADDANMKAEARLQGYFTKRVERFINSRGRKLIGWDELLESDVNESATIMSWRGQEGGLVASEKGHDVIMTPTSHCYFNFYLVEPHEWGEPYAFDALIPLEKTYSFDPAPSTLSEQARSHILGAQGNMWTEYAQYPSQVEYQVLPRMGALAEAVWTKPDSKDYRLWIERERTLTNLYKKKGWSFAPHVFR